ncbi:MAG: hypothetical protein IKE24_01610 [Clostridia bacterium]|nr:hypothetical protein [Clostridia bacterium]
MIRIASIDKSFFLMVVFSILSIDLFLFRGPPTECWRSAPSPSTAVTTAAFPICRSLRFILIHEAGADRWEKNLRKFDFSSAPQAVSRKSMAPTVSSPGAFSFCLVLILPYSGSSINCETRKKRSHQGLRRRMSFSSAYSAAALPGGAPVLIMTVAAGRVDNWASVC